MSIYNKDELVAPNWLSKEFLRKVLREDERNDEIEIESLEITPASMKGDHFASCMFRAKIVYRLSSHTKNTVKCALIIKTMPEEDSKKNEILKDFTLFETEISMYTKTLPEIQRILSEHGDYTVFGPRVIYTALKPRKVIIFEDLCVKGYDCVRGRALSLEEIHAIFIKLAKLHAVSYAIGKSEQARQVNKYQAGLFSNDGFLESDMINGGLKRFKRLLESDDELRVHLPQFRDVENDVFQACMELYNAFKNGEDGDIFVLNHGDFHVRNIMFKHGEKDRLEDIMLVDFQLSVYGPSTIDLIYAVFMMFDAETRRTKRDEHWRFYFEHFIATLKKIKFKGNLPEFGQLQISSIKYRKFAKFLMVTFMPMVHMMFGAKPEDLKDFNTEDFIDNSDALMAFYMNPAFIKDLKAFLPEFLNRGYLD